MIQKGIVTGFKILFLGLIGAIIFMVVDNWWHKYNLPPGWKSCTQNFTEGVTTREELQQALGAPTEQSKIGDYLELKYPYYPQSNRGCVYTFDKSGKLNKIGIYEVVG